MFETCAEDYPGYFLLSYRPARGWTSLPGAGAAGLSSWPGAIYGTRKLSVLPRGMEAASMAPPTLSQSSELPDQTV